MKQIKDKVLELISDIDNNIQRQIAVGNEVIVITKDDDLYTINFIEPTQDPSIQYKEPDTLPAYRTITIRREQLETYLRENLKIK
jgi:hypothetical protein